MGELQREVEFPHRRGWWARIVRWFKPPKSRPYMAQYHDEAWRRRVLAIGEASRGRQAAIERAQGSDTQRLLSSTNVATLHRGHANDCPLCSATRFPNG